MLHKITKTEVGRGPLRLARSAEWAASLAGRFRRTAGYGQRAARTWAFVRAKSERVSRYWRQYFWSVTPHIRLAFGIHRPPQRETRPAVAGSALQRVDLPCAVKFAAQRVGRAASAALPPPVAAAGTERARPLVPMRGTMPALGRSPTGHVRKAETTVSLVENLLLRQRFAQAHQRLDGRARGPASKRSARSRGRCRSPDSG